MKATLEEQGTDFSWGRRCAGTVWRTLLWGEASASRLHREQGAAAFSPGAATVRVKAREVMDWKSPALLERGQGRGSHPSEQNRCRTAGALCLAGGFSAGSLPFPLELPLIFTLFFVVCYNSAFFFVIYIPKIKKRGQGLWASLTITK